MVVDRMPRVEAVLDVQSGGGEVFAWVLRQVERRPSSLVATEAWRPNLEIVKRNLFPFGVSVVEARDAGLPYLGEYFDLVISRHPVVTVWTEIARVRSPAGTYLSQQVGAGSNRELTDFMMGPQPVSEARSPNRAVKAAEAAGLVVVDLREESLLWTVPGFTVDAYRDRLATLHEQIQRKGPFVAHAERFLIEAKRPA
ncbi:MAG: methyltransferase type 11 [Acidimicrobiaceae bacterium]|nr:methyltransferase type 11 [Acidimicrobiaceae bacterium]